MGVPLIRVPRIWDPVPSIAHMGYARYWDMGKQLKPLFMVLMLRTMNKGFSIMLRCRMAVGLSLIHI